MSVKPITLVSFAALACAVAPSSAEKGGEEQALVDGKSDSFFNPTKHGPLGFEITNTASITGDATFHSWEFTLTGEASFSAQTEISGNLDTVMYLYRREPGETSWHAFIDKNDDFDGNLWSRIDHDGDAAEYRIIVKPFKAAMRGGFSVHAQCEGEGCPGAGTGECTPGVFEPIPAPTQISEGCARQFLETLTSEVEFVGDRQLDLGRKCDLSGDELTAVDFFHEWWDGILGFEEAFGFEEDDEVPLELETRFHDEGTTVTVDTFGDEDAISFTFDRNGELLALYQHNQSPTVEWHCGDDGTTQVEEPSEDCVRAALQGLPNGDDAGEADGVTTVDEAFEEEDSRIAAVVKHFAENFDLSETDEVSFSGLLWQSLDFGRGGQLTVRNEAFSALYWVVDGTFGDVQVIAVTDEEGTRFVCET